MAHVSSDRATRFRGEGRPKRKLSPSPPPPKTPVTKSSPPKKPTSKVKEPVKPAPKPVAPKRKQRTPSPVETSEDEVLQSTYKAGDPLPIVREQQQADPPSRAYQSIAESGVLSAALEKSRQRWLSDGVFEKFWVKYSRKNKDEPMPSNQSMTKLNGDCYLVIEPHSFKITLFTVKSSQPALATMGSPAIGQSPLRDTQSPGPIPGLQPPAQSGLQVHPWTPPANLSQTSSSIAKAEPKSEPAAAWSHKPNLPGNEPNALNDGAPTKDIGQPPAMDAPRNNIGTTPKTTGQAHPDGSNNTDPVIQMLAARAATDDDLKNLMKTVAQGKATQEQLSIFQRHIDELNGIIQAQKRKSQSAADKKSTPVTVTPQASAFPPTAPVSSMVTSASTIPNPTSFTFHSSGSVSSTAKIEPFSTYQHPSPAPSAKSKGHASAKQVVTAVVFEFNEANGTRYLVPRNSVLEYLPGNTQAIMSFLVTRKDDAASAEKQDAQQEYYQPVTVRFVADNPKLLEPLARVVSPVEEVRKQMVNTMGSLTLAETVYLATRLPREHEIEASAEAVKVQEPSNVPLGCYDAPNSLLPWRS